MPIHDNSYRRYTGPRVAPGAAWSVIAWTGIRAMLAKRLFLMVMLFAWAQFVVRAVVLYLSANFPQFDVLAVSPAMFRDFFDRQGFFVFIVTVYVGAGLIATDQRVHALQIYLSKPVTRAQYVSGKLAVLLALLLAVTWVPAMMLLLLQVLFSGNLTFLREHLFLIPAITVFSLLYALLASFTMLALSSLSTNARYVGVLYTAALLFSDAVFGVLAAVTRSTGGSWVSFRANLAQIGDVIFRLPPRYETPWVVSFIVGGVVITCATLVLARRVRAVEVVT